jgi:protein arginine kinase activator
MICHICKDKVATIRLKEIINDVVTELHLCEACFEARETRGGAPAQPAAATVVDSLLRQGRAEVVPARCPECGMTEEQFRAKGSGDCYRAFAASLETVLGRIHASTVHCGKQPRRIARNLDLKIEMRRLQEDLQTAILSENYERAAKLRDKLRQFEGSSAARPGRYEEPHEDV